jgi:hypothetical protein
MCRAAGRGLAGSPARPERKAVRGGRAVVPGGDRRHALAVAGSGGSRPGCRPAGRAGLPPGTAGIHPPLRPCRQAGPGRVRGPALASRPEPRVERAGTRLARRGLPSGRAGCRLVAQGARWHAPARYAEWKICHGLDWSSPAAGFLPLLRNRVLRGLFHSLPWNWCWWSRAARLLREVWLPPLALRVPHVGLSCTWRETAQASALIYLAASGQQMARREGVRPGVPAAGRARVQGRYNVRTARPGRLGAVPAAPSVRAACYAALGAASVLAPGSPAVSGAGVAGASW